MSMDPSQRNLLDENETKLFPLELTRIPYLARYLIWFVVVGIVMALLLPIPLVGHVVGPLWVLVAFVYKIAALDIPRVKNIGFSPLILFLYLVPFVNFGLILVLFFAPPKNL
jgi:hypothetical protein